MTKRRAGESRLSSLVISRSSFPGHWWVIRPWSFKKVNPRVDTARGFGCWVAGETVHPFKWPLSQPALEILVTTWHRITSFQRDHASGALRTRAGRPRPLARRATVARQPKLYDNTPPEPGNPN